MSANAPAGKVRKKTGWGGGGGGGGTGGGDNELRGTTSESIRAKPIGVFLYHVEPYMSRDGSIRATYRAKEYGTGGCAARSKLEVVFSTTGRS